MKYRALLLLLLTLCLVGCGKTTDNDTNVTSETIKADSVETDANSTEPQEPYVLTFTAPTIDGEEMSSDILSESKLTMINVWATYCNPCLKEMPDLGEIAASYDKADFQLIGIVSDVSDRSSDKEVQNAKDLIAQTQANFPHLLLNESLYMNLVGAVDSVPTTFFLNNKGEMLGYLIGARDKESWVAIIEELLQTQ